MDALQPLTVRQCKMAGILLDCIRRSQYQISYSELGAYVGLISFDSDGGILISPQLDRQTRDALNLTENLRLDPELFGADEMAYHREQIYTAK